MEETIRNLQQPASYIDAVINARRAGVAEPSGPDGGGGI
jgi:multicomponent K+:H+ antiporter subunit D